jgi:hypothetical protein
MSYFTARGDYRVALGMFEYQKTYLLAYHKLTSFMKPNLCAFRRRSLSAA